MDFKLSSKYILMYKHKKSDPKIESLFLIYPNEMCLKSVTVRFGS